MGFVIDVGLYCAIQLQRAGARIEPEKISSIKAEDDNAKECAATMIRRYLHLSQKRLSRRPRKIHLPLGYSITNPKLQLLLDDVTQGGDLVPYQTKRALLRPTVIDRLLNRFNIQHFHIDHARIKDGSGFYKRSDNLAFAIVTENDFFFIDIISHKDADKNQWFFPDLLTTIENNWPDLWGPELKGITGFCITDETIKSIFSQNVNCAIRLPSGTIVTGPNIGLCGDGTSIAFNREFDSLLIELEKFEQQAADKYPGGKFRLLSMPITEGIGDHIGFFIQATHPNGWTGNVAAIDNALLPLRDI